MDGTYVRVGVGCRTSRCLSPAAWRGRPSSLGEWDGEQGQGDWAEDCELCVADQIAGNRSHNPVNQAIPNVVGERLRFSFRRDSAEC